MKLISILLFAALVLQSRCSDMNVTIALNKLTFTGSPDGICQSNPVSHFTYQKYTLNTYLSIITSNAIYGHYVYADETNSPNSSISFPMLNSSTVLDSTNASTTFVNPMLIETAPQASLRLKIELEVNCVYRFCSSGGCSSINIVRDFVSEQLLISLGSSAVAASSSVTLDYAMSHACGSGLYGDGCLVQCSVGSTCDTGLFQCSSSNNSLCCSESLDGYTCKLETTTTTTTTSSSTSSTSTVSTSISSSTFIYYSSTTESNENSDPNKYQIYFIAMICTSAVAVVFAIIILIIGIVFCSKRQRQDKPKVAREIIYRPSISHPIQDQTTPDESDTNSEFSSGNQNRYSNNPNYEGVQRPQSRTTSQNSRQVYPLQTFNPSGQDSPGYIRSVTSGVKPAIVRRPESYV